MKRKKEKLNKDFNPEKYKMAYCPYCRGTGKSSNGDEKVKICSQCGGFGWVKKEGDDK
jgi:DnaJ-class molecular chaperone